MKTELELYQSIPDKQGKECIWSSASVCHGGKPAAEGLMWTETRLASLNRKEVEKDGHALLESQHIS